MNSKHILVIFSILALIFLIGCAPEITCSSPYIKVGSTCCLDSNSNNICDTDEPSQQAVTPPTQAAAPQQATPVQQPVAQQPYCGDGTCDLAEDCASCESDCGACRDLAWSNAEFECGPTLNCNTQSGVSFEFQPKDANGDYTVIRTSIKNTGVRSIKNIKANVNCQYPVQGGVASFTVDSGDNVKYVTDDSISVALGFGGGDYGTLVSKSGGWAEEVLYLPAVAENHVVLDFAISNYFTKNKFHWNCVFNVYSSTQIQSISKSVSISFNK
jgi:hypothetical protein